MTGRSLVRRSLATAALLAVLAAAVAGRVPRDTEAAAAPAGRTVRVLVDKGAAFERQAAAWAGQGLRVISDCGGFVLAETPESAASAVLAAGSSSVRRVRPEGVRLRRRVLTRDRVRPPAAAAGVHILHFDAPARARWIEAIRGLSAAPVLLPLPHDAFLVSLPD